MARQSKKNKGKPEKVTKTEKGNGLTERKIEKKGE